ncbi:hypothetical protein F0562_001053 [Nyssa sinensis]|uniref:Uncharacterized protein n=1 Tax=Nyssa sinensis TaxID=561372 RepID=A0A5J5C2F5_9ASTE|nr:hypothetical protein F0562_001053 [Nyssa sinensis]
MKESRQLENHASQCRSNQNLTWKNLLLIWPIYSPITSAVKKSWWEQGSLLLEKLLLEISPFWTAMFRPWRVSHNKCKKKMAGVLYASRE